MDRKCDVCQGFGWYPIYNRFGKELYRIECPECGGSGYIDDMAREEAAADEAEAAS